VYHGSFVFGSQNHGDSVITNAQLLPYPSVTVPLDSKTSSQILTAELEALSLRPLQQTPLSIAMTEFHFILLYPKRIQAICILNNELVYDGLLSLVNKENYNNAPFIFLLFLIFAQGKKERF